MSTSKKTNSNDVRVPFTTARIRDKRYQEIGKPKYYSETLNIVNLKSYLKDPHVYSCFQSRRSGVTMHEWDIRTDDDNSYVSEYVREVLSRLNLHSIMESILEAVAFGYSINEIIYQKTKSETGFEFLTVVDVVSRPQEWFTFDNVGQLLFQQGSAKIPVPKDKVLITQHQANSANPYGFATLGTCKLAIEQKISAIKSLMVFVEKYGMPYADITSSKPNITSEELQEIAELADGLLEDGVIVHGNNVSITPLKFNDTGSVSIFLEAINQANTEISKAILSQTLTTETNGQGSYAMSKTHSIVRQDLIDNDIKLVEQTMNRLITLICEKRFGKLDNYPYFVLYEESFIDKAGAETASLLLQNPNLKLTNKFYNRMGLNSDEFELSDAPISAPVMNESPKTISEFADTKRNIFKIAEENDKITDLIDMIATESSDGAKMQFETMDAMLKSVFDLIENAEDYSEVIDKLPQEFKQMNAKKFNEFITKLLLISKVHGRNAVTREVQ